MPFAKGNKLASKEGPEGVTTSYRLNKAEQSVINDYLISQGIEPTIDNCREAVRQLIRHGLDEIRNKLDKNEILIY
jgi:hypothetical protein